MTASHVISPDWLRERLYAPDIRVVDASWHMPDAGRDPQAEFETARIPGAVFFDIDEICDQRTALPHMAPSYEKFALRARRMGLGDGHKIIVYDTMGLFSAARVWWLFRLFGHHEVMVLDGGFPAWRAMGGAIEEGLSDPRERHFSGRRDVGLIRDASDIARILKIGGEQIVDARSPERFRGDVAEPRPGLRAGHIPGSRNLHYARLIQDGRLKDPDALRAEFAAAGVDATQPVTTTCGSGVTAAILNLALAQIGQLDAAVYDGSWAEWGAYDESPVAVGDPA